MVQSKIERDKELPCKSPPVYFINQTTLSTIYGGLKSFKNRLVKIIHSVPGAQLFLKNTKDSCVEFNEQQQIPRKEEKRKFPEFNEEKENDVSKCININGELDDLTDSLTSDTSTQVDITCSCQEDDKKSTHRNLTENNVQASPLISDNRLIVHSSWITGQTSKSPVKRVFLRNKPKKYKICSCGSQCPYTLYKLPCCDQNNVLKKEANDEVNDLMLECSSFEEKNNFPKFVNIDPGEEECFSDFEANESLISSLSVDLELDVCGDYDKLEKEFIDESSKQRNMNHVVKGTSVRRNDNAISHFRTENKPPMYINLETNHQGYRRRTEDFTRDYRSIRSNDKQVQCSSATLRATRRVPVKTSTLDFWQSGSTNRSCRATETTRGINFLKEITPRRMKINVHTQTEKHSYFNRLQNIDLSPALDFESKRKHTENIDEDENKKVLQQRNICDICDFPRQKSWSRMGITHSSYFGQRKMVRLIQINLAIKRVASVINAIKYLL